MKNVAREMKTSVLIGALAISTLLMASMSEVVGGKKCCCCKNRQEQGESGCPFANQRDRQNDRPINDQSANGRNDYQRDRQNDRPTNDQGNRGGRNDGGSPAGEMEMVLELHNKYRREVAQGRISGQPPSSKLKDLKWNAELAEMAQEHARKCVFEHNSGEQRATKTFESVGQNIAAVSTVEEGVNMWFDEHKAYNYESNSCQGACGHYTQMVWADSTDLGCGVAKCNLFGFDLQLLVCHYGPAGNYIGQKPY